MNSTENQTQTQTQTYDPEPVPFTAYDPWDEYYRNEDGVIVGEYASDGSIYFYAEGE